MTLPTRLPMFRRAVRISMSGAVLAALLAASGLSVAAEPGGSADGVAIVVPGTVQAFFVTDLYAKDSGYISAVNADIGDHVKKGQVLAVIDDPELQAQFDKARASRQQNRAALDVAMRQLLGLQADLALRDVTLRRQRALFAGKAATAQSLDEAQAKEAVSKANLETGKAKIGLAQANLQVAEAETERLRALVGYDHILAPFDGVVTRRLVNPGDLVQAATTTRMHALFTCQQIDRVRVFAFVPEINATSVRPGLAAAIKLYGKTRLVVHGAVTRIATALDPTTRTMRVEIDLPNPLERLLPGMYAQVTLGSEPRQLAP
jgi:multidrug efflux pump subunit AcrA (membrane-fusion protein)